MYGVVAAWSLSVLSCPVVCTNSRKERATEGLVNIGKIPLVTFYKFLLLHFGKIVRRYYGGVA